MKPQITQIFTDASRSHSEPSTIAKVLDELREEFHTKVYYYCDVSYVLIYDK